MSDALNVLVIESELGLAETARAELEAAGHTTFRCHEAHAPAFPCNALVDGKQCPLDTVDIDVALVTRRHPSPQPTPMENGATCAIRRHVPLVVTGPRELNPYEDFAAVSVDSADDVVANCERAAATADPACVVAAQRATRDTLDRRGVDATPNVTIRRIRGALHVFVTGTAMLDEPTKSMLAVRISGAVRAVDRDARGIDVMIT